jgi:hypothetical protein
MVLAYEIDTNQVKDPHGFTYPHQNRERNRLLQAARKGRHIGSAAASHAV